MAEWKKANRSSPKWLKACAICGDIVAGEFYYRTVDGLSQIAHAECIERPAVSLAQYAQQTTQSQPVQPVQPVAQTAQPKQIQKQTQAQAAPQPVKKQSNASVYHNEKMDVLRSIASELKQANSILSFIQQSLNAIKQELKVKNELLYVHMCLEYTAEKVDSALLDLWNSDKKLKPVTNGDSNEAGKQI